MSFEDWEKGYLEEAGVGASKRAHLRNTLSVSARVGARELVGALNWLRRVGVYPKSRGTIVGECVRRVAELGGESEWPTLEQAHAFLDANFPVATKVGGKQVRASRIRDTEKRREAYERANLGKARGGQAEIGQAQMGDAPWGEPQVEQREGKTYLIFPTQKDVDAFVAARGGVGALGVYGICVMTQEEWEHVGFKI